MSLNRGAVAHSIVGLAAIATAVLVAGCGGSPAGAPGAAGNTTGDIFAAVVNINGVVTDGHIAGTGMIIASDGIVLTNNHVVAGTTRLTAQVGAAGRVYNATVLGVDPSQDVAVIRLEGASHLPTVPVEASGVLNLGDPVTALGNALGKNGAPAVVTGHVTSLDETLTVLSEGDAGVNSLSGLIQMNAPIQPGDSGGPLLNGGGRVIGMDTAGTPSQGTGASHGDAIPINTAIDIARQITSGATSPYIQSGHSGVLGITVVAPSGGGGARVSTVVSGEAAAGAGMAVGDVITAFNGTGVASPTDFATASQGWRPGDLVTVSWRDPSGGAHQAGVSLSPGPPA
ncbi:MAG: trypsin-like peptidase domain-containing protein [Candidatus Dormibacteraeota bacterium]|uniref:Trypsin-like peptidase domain-containing protein n=1 Tax=Candidatus Amunia macphersoniae TaxID=3127014 RepID=A0A934KHL0_9BACT|nr:trypsin-like peptidase domain-containing protein [Candidatus Dormibacteraeota bacterium]